jgi:hypothetical protein
MLKIRNRRRTARIEQAVAQVADIHASIALLNDEDLLDLADIFVEAPPSTLKGIAAAEMRKRNIRL